MEKKQESLIVDATMENLDAVMGYVEEQLESEACPLKISRQICVSLEEIYVNVVNYAYGNDVGKCEIHSKIETYDNEKQLILSVKDKGIPFNPLEREDPDITLSVEERQIGGLGIYMVKKSMDEVTYENISGYNILTIQKKWKI